MVEQYIPFNDLNYVLGYVAAMRSSIENSGLPPWAVSTIDDVMAVSMNDGPRIGKPMQHQYPDFWAGIHKVSLETVADLFKHLMEAAAHPPVSPELARVAARAETVFAAGMDYAGEVRKAIRSKNPEIGEAVAESLARFQQNGREIANHRKANIRRYEAGKAVEHEETVVSRTEAFAAMLDQALADDPQLQAMKYNITTDPYSASRFDPALISPEALGTLAAVYSFTARNGLLTSPTQDMMNVLQKIFQPGLEGAVVMAQVIEALENPPYNMPHYGHSTDAIRSVTSSTLPSLMVAQQAMQIMRPGDRLVAMTQRTFNNLRKDIGVEGPVELKSGKHVALMMVAMASVLPEPQKESVMEQAEKVAVVQDDKELQSILSRDEHRDALNVLYAQQEGSADYNEGITLLQRAMAEPQALSVNPRLAGALKKTTKPATASAASPSRCPFS